MMWRPFTFHLKQKANPEAQDTGRRTPGLFWPLAPATFSYFLISPFQMLEPLWIIPLLLWSGIALLFPMRGFLIVLATGMGANALLTMANLHKISINGMPITALDIHITTANPEALWQSLGIAVWLGWLITGACVSSSAFTLLMLARRIRYRTLVSCASILATLSLTATVGAFYSEKMFVYVKNLQAAHNLALWNNQRVSALSKSMGSIPFLIYSWKLEQEAGAEFFKHSLNAQDIPAASLSESYKKHFQRHVGLKPNIVMIQLESIFNPNTAFELDRKISSSLFEENQYSHLVGPMQVNIIGGGSWVSEFEAINGLDSRLFGYSGYYTHVTIAPYINGSFPKHLHDRGYATFAFYPTYGLFYNVGSAYRRYGFEEFRDWKDLKLSQDWAASDSELAAAFVKGSLDFDSSKPFFPISSRRERISPISVADLNRHLHSWPLSSRPMTGA